MGKVMIVQAEHTTGVWIWKETRTSTSTFHVPDGVDAEELGRLLMVIAPSVKRIGIADAARPVDPDERYC